MHHMAYPCGFTRLYYTARYLKSEKPSGPDHYYVVFPPSDTLERVLIQPPTVAGDPFQNSDRLGSQKRGIPYLIEINNSEIQDLGRIPTRAFLDQCKDFVLNALFLLQTEISHLVSH